MACIEYFTIQLHALPTHRSYVTAKETKQNSHNCSVRTKEQHRHRIQFRLPLRIAGWNSCCLVRKLINLCVFVFLGIASLPKQWYTLAYITWIGMRLWSSCVSIWTNCFLSDRVRNANRHASNTQAKNYSIFHSINWMAEIQTYEMARLRLNQRKKLSFDAMQARGISNK